MKDEVQVVEWAMLVPHAKRDALILVDTAVPLVAAAEALRDDDAASVQKWLAANQLVRVPIDEERTMNELYEFVIVQPFVLAQGPLKDASLAPS